MRSQKKFPPRRTGSHIADVNNLIDIGEAPKRYADTMVPKDWAVCVCVSRK